MASTKYNFFAAVYLIIKKDNKILLSRRFNTGWMDGMYILPSGHVDGNETSQQAMSREAKEEINLDIAPEDLSVVLIMHRKSEDSNREYFDLFLEPKTYGGELKNNEENKCDNLEWFPIDALPDNTLSNVKEALKLIEGGQHFASMGFE